MSDQTSLSLTENAFDFLLKAAENVRQGDRRSLKYSLLHLASSLELLLKARLYREDWTLIFRDPDKATEDALNTGEFKSVDFETAIDLVEDITLKEIDSNVKKNLRNIRTLRNKVQHFSLAIEKEQMISLLAKGHNFVVDFCKSELQGEIREHAGSFAAIIEHLGEFDEFVSERLKSIKADLEESNALWDCPRCSQYSLKIGDPPPTCAFCGFIIPSEELADSITEGGRGICPHCDHDACAVIVYNNDEAGWFCAACGVREEEEEQYVRCLRCDRLIYTDDVLCANCWEQVWAKD